MGAQRIKALRVADVSHAVQIICKQVLTQSTNRIVVRVNYYDMQAMIHMYKCEPGEARFVAIVLLGNIKVAKPSELKEFNVNKIDLVFIVFTQVAISVNTDRRQPYAVSSKNSKQFTDRIFIMPFPKMLIPLISSNY